MQAAWHYDCPSEFIREHTTSNPSVYSLLSQPASLYISYINDSVTLWSISFPCLLPIFPICHQKHINIENIFSINQHNIVHSTRFLNHSPNILSWTWIVIRYYLMKINLSFVNWNVGVLSVTLKAIDFIFDSYCLLPHGTCLQSYTAVTIDWSQTLVYALIWVDWCWQGLFRCNQLLIMLSVSV